MIGKSFIDTNMLVYAYDVSDPGKQQSALKIIGNLVTDDSSYISTQVLSEFWVTVTRKISNPLSVEDAEERIKSICQLWTVLQVNEAIIFEAVRGVKTHHFSYWDSLIWATARLNQVNIVFSEDFSHDSSIEGIRFINPFK